MMRLTKNEMERLADFIFLRLKERERIILKAGEEEVRRRIYEEIEKDIVREHELDEEVERLIDEHIDRAGETVNRRKLFQMIKGKLAKERGIVL
ncbi:MAG: DUF507 family protein [Deltaproteobacteria bacterium]|nr:MAG: DUF507 family protein [Deltaproteobacteria bacterium]